MLRAAGLSDGLALELCFRFTDDEGIRELNRNYRNQDKTTDVLAFAQREGPMGALQPENLGDVIISVPAAQRQTKGSLFDELLFLASHGLCHTLGYDHQNDADESKMNARMKDLLQECNGRGPVCAA